MAGPRDRAGRRLRARDARAAGCADRPGRHERLRGQRQRLAIARTLVKRPEIYVFDDSFSALDTATDARLRAALDREVAGATRIVVAQRVSTILEADQIVVLEDGAVVGIGTHHELLESSAEYAEIVASQLSIEEAA